MSTPRDAHDPAPRHEQRALVIAAHPDDTEFGAGATLAAWADAGWKISIVIVTSGQRGVQDATAKPEAIARMREAEAREAADCLGAAEVRFLGYMDAEVVADQRLARDLSREFRRAKPHRLVTINPELLQGEGFINHPDHRRVGRTAIDVTLTGGTTAAIFPELELDEGLPPWTNLQEIWLMGPSGGPEVVDVTATFARKLSALKSHRSQLAQLPPDILEHLSARSAQAGAAHGFAYAESFRVLGRRTPSSHAEEVKATSSKPTR